MVKREEIPSFGNLQGVRVVVSAVSTAGPFAGELFAENGADVIWLEPPRGIDPYRWTQDGWGVQNERRNMRNLMLDVVRPEGREVFLKVIETADIFIEASRGGQWEKWGYPDEVLWERNPKLVIGHMSGYGLTGDPDYVSLPGYDFTVNAFSGLMYLNGYKDGPPYMIQKFVTDYYAGLFAYGAALAGYVNALRTGEGESFDLAQYEAAVRCQAGLFGKWFEKQIQEERGSGAPRDNISAGAGYYECKDGEGVYPVSYTHLPSASKPDGEHPSGNGRPVRHCGRRLGEAGEQLRIVQAEGAPDRAHPQGYGVGRPRMVVPRARPGRRHAVRRHGKQHQPAYPHASRQGGPGRFVQVAVVQHQQDRGVIDMRQMLAIDYEYCSGCHTCEIACQQEHGLAPDKFGIELKQIGPDEISKNKWQYEFLPVPTDRCDRCAVRQSQGKLPSCVQHCQAGCIYVGTLEELADKLGKKKVALFS